MNSKTPQEQVLRLFPEPGETIPLRGLYLKESLRPEGTPDQPFVYANFITSLDGRISLPDPETKTRKVPQAIANPRDWRLFQELAASADMLVTSGRYIRDLAAGAAQSGLPVLDKPEFADLLEWREEQGLAPQPAVTIVTGTLDLPIPGKLLQSKRPVYAAIGAEADHTNIETLRDQGVNILRAGSGIRVEGQPLIDTLLQEGFCNIDMIGGGELLNTLLTDNVLHRLYLTHACRILGGRSFDTLLKGPQLEPPADFKLRSLFFDSREDDAMQQLFAAFDRKPE